MSPDLEFWMKTVRLEYDTLVRMGCWDIVDVPSDTKFLGVRWVFKIKMIENEYERHKARLVVNQPILHNQPTCNSKACITRSRFRQPYLRFPCVLSWH